MHLPDRLFLETCQWSQRRISLRHHISHLLRLLLREILRHILLWYLQDLPRYHSVSYSSMEAELQNYLDTYTATHSYDEYHFDLDEIEHDPYVLISILCVLHEDADTWMVQDEIPRTQRKTGCKPHPKRRKHTKEGIKVIKHKKWENKNGFYRVYLIIFHTFASDWAKLSPRPVTSPVVIPVDTDLVWMVLGEGECGLSEFSCWMFYWMLSFSSSVSSWMVSLGSNLGEMRFLGVRLMPFSISAWRTTLPLPSESWLKALS